MLYLWLSPHISDSFYESLTHRSAVDSSDWRTLLNFHRAGSSLRWAQVQGSHQRLWMLSFTLSPSIHTCWFMLRNTDLTLLDYVPVQSFQTANPSTSSDDQNPFSYSTTIPMNQPAVPENPATLPVFFFFFCTCPNFSETCCWIQFRKKNYILIIY